MMILFCLKIAGYWRYRFTSLYRFIFMYNLIACCTVGHCHHLYSFAIGSFLEDAVVVIRLAAIP